MDTSKLFDGCYDKTRSGSVNSAISYLRNKIIIQDFAAGAQITEQLLADECNISRGTARMALKELEKEGLIRSLNNGRKQVVGFTLKYVDDLYKMREMLEVTALKGILDSQEHERRSEVELLQTATLPLRWSDNGKENLPIERVSADAEFHRTIIRASGNQALLQCWNTVEPVVWVLLNVNATLLDEDTHLKQYKTHKELVKQIIMNDNRALEALKEHIWISHELVKGVLKELGCK